MLLTINTPHALDFLDDEVVSSLPLQMSLYFNLWFFPVWWICEVVMLQVKVRSYRTVIVDLSAPDPSCFHGNITTQ